MMPREILVQAGIRQNVIVVGIGECRVGCAPTNTLSTFALGSCIAVMAWDWKLKLGGLLHVMLPDSSVDPVKALSKPYVYVDTGVPTLFRELVARGSARKQLRWCLAGGAAMMGDSSHFEIGKRNHLALKKVLWRLRVFINQEDVGGTESRSVKLDLQTGQIDLRKGMAREQILTHAALNSIKAEFDEKEYG
jgi:chemotaxis protein CheD